MQHEIVRTGGIAAGADAGSEKPVMAIPDKFDGYRNAAWLLKRHAVSVLPSVTSLKALRAFVRRDQNIKPMTGFGDPLFDPSQASGSKRCADDCLAQRGERRLYRILARRRRRTHPAGEGIAATA
jgi:hypothetical protein